MWTCAEKVVDYADMMFGPNSLGCCLQLGHDVGVVVDHTDTELA